MDKQIEFFVANPSGNITAFVITDVERDMYKIIADKIFAMKELAVEQVGFIKEKSMEMSGLEFCGNASRSYALFLAKQRNLSGSQEMHIEVSGCKEPLWVMVNTDTNYTCIEMPKPSRIIEYKGSLSGILVDLDGIMHLIVTDVPATLENFNEIKNEIMQQYDVPAFGVMFCDSKLENMVPVVYVKDVDSTYFEGSCGSGSTALAIALSRNEEDGHYSYTVKQPKGILTASVEVKNRKIHKVFIEGPVDLGNIISMSH